MPRRTRCCSRKGRIARGNGQRRLRTAVPWFGLTIGTAASVDLRGSHVSLFPMIKVTERAVAHLRQLLAEHSAAPGKGLRVQVAKGGCSGMQYEMSLDL